MSGPLGSQHWMYATAAGCGFDEDIPFSIRLDEAAESYMSRSVSSTGDQQKFTYSSWVKSLKASESNDTLFAEATDVNNRSSIHIRHSGFGDPGAGTPWGSGSYDPTVATAGTVAAGWDPDYPCAIEFIEVSGGTTRAQLVSNRNIGNDTASWFHVTISVDTTQATASDRIKMYINGIEETDFAVATYPAQNTSLRINLSGQTATVNTYQYDTTACGSVQLARSVLVDGEALDASSFGCFELGVWLPKAYSGSFGTNGFLFEYGTASSMGDDTSGNSNNMTTTNVTANDQTPDTPTNTFGSWDWHTAFALPNDAAQGPTPNNTTRTASFINWGPHRMKAGNTDFQWLTNGYYDDTIKSTMAFPSTGKWYYEIYGKWTLFNSVGINTMKHLNGRSESFGYHGRDTQDYNGYACRFRMTGSIPNGTSWMRGIGVNGATGANYGQISSIAGFVDDRAPGYVYGDPGASEGTIGIAVDMDNHTITWYCQGNVVPEVQNTAIEVGVRYIPCVTMFSVTATNPYGAFAVLNMGQDSSFNGRKTRGNNTDANGIGDFRYAPPAGHLALCTANIPELAMDPGVNQDTPQNHFKAVTWTGDGQTGRSVTVGFQPDFIWAKNRDTSDSHQWYDAVRGVGKRIRANSGSGEATTGTSTHLTSFDADGMTIGANGNMNASTEDYVGYFMKMAGSSSTNTNGTITSTVSANQTAGMSIVKWVGNATNGATVGHGLTKKPQFMMIKNLDHTQDWYVWSQGLPLHYGSGDIRRNSQPLTADGYISLNQNSVAGTTTNGNINTLTTSTMSLATAGNNLNVNSSADNFIAYVFHDVEGFSQSGEYHGVSAHDAYWATKSKSTVCPAMYGTFIHTGFRPAFVMVKCAEWRAGAWCVYDDARSVRKPIVETLDANSSAAERNTGGDPIEFLSNGFRFAANSDLDMVDVTYNFVYIAFASTSQKYATAVVSAG